MTHHTLRLPRCAITLVAREATRQANYHHEHHCGAHTTAGWDTAAPGQSAGCHLWSTLEHWCSLQLGAGEPSALILQLLTPNPSLIKPCEQVQ